MGALLSNSFRWNSIVLLVVLLKATTSGGNVHNLQIHPHFRFQGPSPRLSRSSSMVGRESGESPETLWLSESSNTEESSIEQQHQTSTAIDNRNNNNHHHHHNHHSHPHPNRIVKEPSSSQPDHCPGCQLAEQEAKLSSETLRNLRLERIKEKILKKLRLKEPPKVSGVKALPDPFIATTYHQSHNNRASTSGDNGYVDDFYGKTEQVIVYSEEGE